LVRSLFRLQKLGAACWSASSQHESVSDKRNIFSVRFSVRWASPRVSFFWMRSFSSPSFLLLGYEGFLGEHFFWWALRSVWVTISDKLLGELLLDDECFTPVRFKLACEQHEGTLRNEFQGSTAEFLSFSLDSRGYP
jgi:hypothetical protein